MRCDQAEKAAGLWAKASRLAAAEAKATEEFSPSESMVGDRLACH